MTLIPIVYQYKNANLRDPDEIPLYLQEILSEEFHEIRTIRYKATGVEHDVAYGIIKLGNGFQYGFCFTQISLNNERIERYSMLAKNNIETNVLVLGHVQLKESVRLETVLDDFKIWLGDK